MEWRQELEKILFNTNTVASKRFDLFLFVVIFASVLVVLLDSIETIYFQYKLQLNIAEIIFTLLFTLEYFLRLLVASSPLKYAFSFYGIVDFLSIIPTYISFFFMGIPSLFSLKLLRVLRIFRILKLIEFWREAKILAESLKHSFYKIIVFLMVVFILVFIIGSLMYLIEGKSSGFSNIPQSIYWTIVTITTVGYGDIAPQTPLGKLLASSLMLIGYGIIAVPTGIVTVDLANSYQENMVKNTQKICSNCVGFHHDSDAKYCKYCGKNLFLNQGENKIKFK
jgi:voltage-gated potassium channel